MDDDDLQSNNKNEKKPKWISIRNYDIYTRVGLVLMFSAMAFGISSNVAGLSGNEELSFIFLILMIISIVCIGISFIFYLRWKKKVSKK